MLYGNAYIVGAVLSITGGDFGMKSEQKYFLSIALIFLAMPINYMSQWNCSLTPKAVPWIDGLDRMNGERRTMGTGKRESQGWPAFGSSVLTAEIIRGQKRAGTTQVVACTQTWESSRVSIALRSNAC